MNGAEQESDRYPEQLNFLEQHGHTLGFDMEDGEGELRSKLFGAMAGMSASYAAFVVVDNANDTASHQEDFQNTIIKADATAESLEELIPLVSENAYELLDDIEIRIATHEQTAHDARMGLNEIESDVTPELLGQIGIVLLTGILVTRGVSRFLQQWGKEIARKVQASGNS